MRSTTPGHDVHLFSSADRNSGACSQDYASETKSNRSRGMAGCNFSCVDCFLQRIAQLDLRMQRHVMIVWRGEYERRWAHEVFVRKVSGLRMRRLQAAILKAWSQQVRFTGPQVVDFDQSSWL